MNPGLTPIRTAPLRCPETGVEEEACDIYLSDLRDNIFAKQVALDGIRNLTRYSKDEARALVGFISRLKANNAHPDLVRRFETQLDKMLIFICQLFVEGISAMVKQDLLSEDDVQERVRKIVEFEMANNRRPVAVSTQEDGSFVESKDQV